MTTRRELLKDVAATAAAAVGGLLLPGCRGGMYSVSVLGDIHFDSPDKKLYHSLYTRSTTRKRYLAHLAEHERNAEMWAARMPRLVRASGAVRTADTAFALQVGDLVQGDCGDGATHAKMLDDAFSFLKKAYGGNLPLVIAAGNHDIRGDIEGDGARQSLETWLPRQMARELRTNVAATTFSFRHGPDAFIVADFNEPNPDFALVKRLLEEARDARYVFFVTHGPVIPNGQSRWFLYGSEKRTAERIELLKLLARCNAIVLAGHTHNLEYYDCDLKEGRVTQLVFNSVWAEKGWKNMRTVASGPENYGDTDAKRKGGGDMDRLVAEYRPFVKQFLFAKAAGHYRLEVSDERVEAVFYGGDAASPSRVFRLR